MANLVTVRNVTWRPPAMIRILTHAGPLPTSIPVLTGIVASLALPPWPRPGTGWPVISQS